MDDTNGLIVKERPILFSTPMVRAILEGRKTMTRRIVKPQFPDDVGWAVFESQGYFPVDDDGNPLVKPHFIIGQHLWVKETWANVPLRSGKMGAIYRADGDDAFDNIQEGWEFMGKWTPSIHMFRWASRITLEVTEVRVERLHEISEGDAKAEGLLAQVGGGTGPGTGYKWNGVGYHGAGFVGRIKEKTFHVPDIDGRCSCNERGTSPSQCAFRELWESINGKGSWADNPWVRVLSFKRMEAK